MNKLDFAFDGQVRTASISIAERSFYTCIDRPSRFSALVADLSTLRFTINAGISGSMAERFVAEYPNMLVSIIVQGLDGRTVNITVDRGHRVARSGIHLPLSRVIGNFPGGHLWVEGLLRTVPRP